MASHRRTTVSSPTPCFAKTLKNPGVAKMRIPRKFVMKYADDLSNRALLKVPSGAQWEVKIKRHDGDVWFENGWLKFSQYYGLHVGIWLLFRYEGNSRFQVSMMNSSGIEIEYLVSSEEDEDEEDGGEENEEDVEEEDDKSVEILEDFVPSHLPPKKHRAKSSVASSSRGNLALQAANEFVSEFPFFKTTLGVSRKLYVPSCFKKVLGVQNKMVIVRLRVHDRSWCVKMFDHTRASYQLCAGWAAFRDENRLKEGDVCILELINKTKLWMNVNIFRC